MLLNNGADVNFKVIFKYFKNFLRIFTNINLQNGEGSTALQLASYYGNMETVEILLNNGANINEKDNINQTALLLASYSGQTTIIELLLGKNADINSKTIKGFTVLHLGIIFYLLFQKKII